MPRKLKQEPRTHCRECGARLPPRDPSMIGRKPAFCSATCRNFFNRVAMERRRQPIIEHSAVVCVDPIPPLVADGRYYVRRILKGNLFGIDMLDVLWLDPDGYVHKLPGPPGYFPWRFKRV